MTKESKFLGNATTPVILHRRYLLLSLLGLVPPTFAPRPPFSLASVNGSYLRKPQHCLSVSVGIADEGACDRAQERGVSARCTTRSTSSSSATSPAKST
eukprot:935892-Rhodomonas_salina.2